MSESVYCEIPYIAPILVLLPCIWLGASYVWSFLITDPISLFLQVSYLTGASIVNKFLSICNFTIEITRLLHSFFEIFFEDSLIFFKDAGEKIIFGLTLLKKCYSLLEEGFLGGCAFVSDAYNVLFGPREVVPNFFGFLQLTLITTKQMLCLAGSSIWNFTLSIPGMVITGIIAIYDLLSTTAQEIYNLQCMFHKTVIQSFEKSLEFLFDFPLDAVCGLVIGGVLITIFCIKIKGILLLISSGLVKIYHCTTSPLTYLWTRRLLDQEEKVDFTEDIDRLCVICQHKVKEIIIFPCRHLCLCSDCSVVHAKTNNYCPVCRGYIVETLKVYV